VSLTATHAAAALLLTAANNIAKIAIRIGISLFR
jgi:hypothetical protein